MIYYEKNESVSHSERGSRPMKNRVHRTLCGAHQLSCGPRFPPSNRNRNYALNLFWLESLSPWSLMSVARKRIEVYTKCTNFLSSMDFIRFELHFQRLRSILAIISCKLQHSSRQKICNCIKIDIYLISS